MSHGMRIVARSQTAKCGALGARRRPSEQDPSPPSLPCSRNIGTACGLHHWVDGPSDGRANGPPFCCLTRPFDRGDRVADRPLHILLASNSASNLTDRILLPIQRDHGRAHVADLLRRKEARVNPAQRRRRIAFPLYFLHDDADSLPPSALLRPRPPRTKIRIIDFTSINHAGDGGERQVGRRVGGSLGERARLSMTLFSALRPVFRRHSRGGGGGESTSRRCCLRTSTD